MRFFFIAAMLMFVPASVAALSPVYCPVEMNSAYKSTADTSVFYVTEQCQKRVFTSADMYFTYFDSWDDVQTIPAATLDSVHEDPLGVMPYGPNYDPKYGALVKTVDDPKVYFLLGNEKRWVDSEDTFEELGYTWDWVEDVDASLLDKYTNGDVITSETGIPYFSLVKIEGQTEVYRIEPSKEDVHTKLRRHISSQSVFDTLGYRLDRIIEIPTIYAFRLTRYPEGDAIMGISDTYTPNISALRQTDETERRTQISYTRTEGTNTTGDSLGFSYEYPTHLEVWMPDSRLWDATVDALGGTFIVTSHVPYMDLNDTAYQLYVISKYYIPPGSDMREDITEAVLEATYYDFPHEPKPIITTGQTLQGTEYTDVQVYNTQYERHIHERFFVRENYVYTIGLTYTDDVDAAEPIALFEHMTNSIEWAFTPYVRIPETIYQRTIHGTETNIRVFTHDVPYVSFAYPSAWTPKESDDSGFSETDTGTSFTQLFTFPEDYGNTTTVGMGILVFPSTEADEIFDFDVVGIFRGMFGVEHNRIHMVDTPIPGYLWEDIDTENTGGEIGTVLLIEHQGYIYMVTFSYHQEDAERLQSAINTVISSIRLIQ